MGTWIFFFTDVVQHLAIGGLGAAHKDDCIKFFSKRAELFVAVGNLSADGVVGMHRNPIIGEDLVDFVKLIRAFGGLAIECDVFRHVGDIQLRDVLKDHGLIIGLSQEPNHLGMPMLAIDVDIVCFVEGVFDAVLKLKHHRATSIDECQVVFDRKLVGGGWLTVGTDQYFFVPLVMKLLVVDDL